MTTSVDLARKALCSAPQSEQVSTSCTVSSAASVAARNSRIARELSAMTTRIGWRRGGGRADFTAARGNVSLHRDDIPAFVYSRR